MHAEEAGEEAARHAGRRWESTRGALVRAGAPDGDRLTDELLLLLYFAGQAAVHFALFDEDALKKRVQTGFSLAWDRFAREKSPAAGRDAADRLQEYTRSLQQGASAVAGTFCRFLGCGSTRVERAAASLFDRQVTATMKLVMNHRSEGLA
ncbi:MAG: hypothetical protein ACOC8N_08485 [Spirochaetota bacterium]